MQQVHTYWMPTTPKGLGIVSNSNECQHNLHAPVTGYFFAKDVIQVLKVNSTATIGDAIFLGNGVVFGILFLIGYIWGYCRKKSAGRWLMYYSLLGMILGYVGFFIVFMVLKNFAIQYEKLGNE